MEKGNKIILIIGILSIAAGILVFYEASSFREKAILTEGKVVHVIGTSYKIQYFTEDGTEKVCQGSGKNHGFREGNTVKVWYSKDDHDRARYTDRDKIARMLIIGGIVGILLGVYPLLMRKKLNAAN
jgi:uncharacterized membrane protein HdeD (DUF308 family)